MKRLFCVFPVLTVLLLNGCVHRQKTNATAGSPKENAFRTCQEENEKMRGELTRKNTRLRTFNQLNPDGSLRGDQE